MDKLNKKNIDFISTSLLCIILFNTANYIFNSISYDDIDEFYTFYDQYCNPVNTTNPVNTNYSFYCDCYSSVLNIYNFNFSVFILTFIVPLVISCFLCSAVNQIKKNQNVKVTFFPIYFTFCGLYLFPLIFYGTEILYNLLKDKHEHDTDNCIDGIKTNFGKEFLCFKITIAQIYLIFFCMLFECITNVISRCFVRKVKDDTQKLIEVPPPYET
jgi:hypothetical protein